MSAKKLDDKTAAMRRWLILLEILTVAVAAGLIAAHGNIFGRLARNQSPPVEPAASTPTKSSTQSSALTRGSNDPIAADQPAWLTEARNDPDPRVRLNAIEAWARVPNASLDPITLSLVDPDEHVRARAQELLDEALARK